MAPSRDLIRAAGVVLTRGTGKELRVAVIHRRRRRDWSLPKGKLKAGEVPAEAAVRECAEETGMTAVLGIPLPTQKYRVDGVPKVVHYWRATHVNGSFVENREVDRLRWMRPREAAAVMTYPRDGQLVLTAVRAAPTLPFVLLRHTSAERRADWERRTGRRRDDPERDLLERGHWEARRLVPLLRAFGVKHLHSSDAQRCLSTVAPMAASLGVGVRLEPTIGEDAFCADPEAGLTRTAELFAQPWPLVLCSHRPVIPRQLAHLRSVAGGSRFLHRFDPGGFVVFHRVWPERSGSLPVRVAGGEQHDPPHAHE
jgi:8-oxo-(d)GTP phosphatase